MSKQRLCFAGTPEFAADHLACLIEDGQEIAGVYTQPDRPAGRGKKLQASPVKKLAEQHGLHVLQPKSLRTADAQDELRALDPDLLIVVAYGLILPQEVLDIPRHGCINVHASLLPRWRGAAPIERALLAGDEVTGVTIMQMDAGLDTGPMLCKSAVDIAPDDDRVSLTEKISTTGQAALLDTLREFAQRSKDAQDQDDSLSTYANKLEKQESLLNWELPANRLDLVIRATAGRFPAYSFIAGQRIRIIKAALCNKDQSGQPGTIVNADRAGALVACGEGALLIERVQLPGKKPCAVSDLLNARSEVLVPGGRFTSNDGQ